MSLLLKTIKLLTTNCNLLLKSNSYSYCYYYSQRRFFSSDIYSIMGGASSSYKDPADIPNEVKANVLGLESHEKPSLEAVARKIKSGEIKKIVCLCGAGISVSCGIPDFRSKGSGLYDNLQQYNLERPEDMFDIEFFKDNPKPFIHLAKKLYPGQYKPSVTHFFLKLLEKHNMLLRVYTQNIDGLEYLAGLSHNKVIQCHGGFQSSHCVNPDCDAPCDNERLKENILAEKETYCEKCLALCKPAITFFGEALPGRYFDAKSVDFVRHEKECCFAECKDPTIVKPDGSRNFFCEWHMANPGKDRDKTEGNITENNVDNTEGEGDEEELSEEERRGKLTCEADLIIVLGTSLQVAPVSGLVDDVHWLCPRVLINREKVHEVGAPNPAWPPFLGPDNGFRFDKEDNYRDVACIMDCDDGTRHLANLLGWEDELNELVAAGQSSPADNDETKK